MAISLSHYQIALVASDQPDLALSQSCHCVHLQPGKAIGVLMKMCTLDVRKDGTMKKRGALCPYGSK